MTEPSTTTAAAASGAAGAVFVAIVGVEPQAIVWGLVGAIFGLGLAPATGRMRAALLFVAVSLASALLGTFAAAHWHAGSAVARNAWAVGLGAVFHPLFAAVVQAVPAAVHAMFRARTGQGPGGQP